MAQELPGGDGDVCHICLEASPPPMQSGCACRGAAGLAHVGCRVKAAQALVERQGRSRWWFTCQTCEQRFTGALCIGLANAWWSQVRDRAEEDPERLEAANNLATSLDSQGKHAEAEEMLRAVLAVRKRVQGAEHPDTLTTAHNLANSLYSQRKHAEAEEILREVLAVRKRVLGAEHPGTLTTASTLAASLSRQGKHAEAEEMVREVLAVRKRVQGAEHPDTLTTATFLELASLRQELASKRQVLEDKLASARESEVQATRKRAAEGSGACADGSKRRK